MEYRRITRACAARDWDASTHEEVVAGNKGNHLLKRFLGDDTHDACHAGKNTMDRARDCSGPGGHIIGNLHVKAPAARRAWLWRDTGELDPFGKEAKIDWMIAEGPRKKGHSSDLQASHIDILCDSNDTWLPTTAEDYADLAVEHDKGWIGRAREAVAVAVQEAEQHRDTLIEVDIGKVNAQVAQAGGVELEVSVAVLEVYAERWIIISRLDKKHKPVTEEEATALALAAFDDEHEIQEIAELTTILDGAVEIDPGRFYAWTAIV